jgi:hypothetical protein
LPWIWIVTFLATHLQHITQPHFDMKTEAVRFSETLAYARKSRGGTAPQKAVWIPVPCLRIGLRVCKFVS